MDEPCASCHGACCKCVVIRMNTRADAELAKARGLEIVDGFAIIPMRCPNLDDEGKCGIYDTRPLSCRTGRMDSDWCRACRKACSISRSGD